MDGLREYYTQSSKAEKDKYHDKYHMINIKRYDIRDESLYKTEIENKHGYQSGKGRREE